MAREEAVANIADAIREYLGATSAQPEGAEIQEIEVPVYQWKSCRASCGLARAVQDSSHLQWARLSISKI